MHQMNDYQRDMISQRHQHDMHDAQQWRQAHTSDPDPAPLLTNEARPSLVARFIMATVQRIRRVLTASRQPDQAISRSIDTPVEFR